MYTDTRTLHVNLIPLGGAADKKEKQKEISIKNTFTLIKDKTLKDYKMEFVAVIFWLIFKKFHGTIMITLKGSDIRHVCRTSKLLHLKCLTNNRPFCGSIDGPHFRLRVTLPWVSKPLVIHLFFSFKSIHFKAYLSVFPHA